MPDDFAIDEQTSDDVVPSVTLDAATITDALARSGGNKQHAATLLGVSRTTLWRRMRDEHLL